jgi:hypothetical protein
MALKTNKIELKKLQYFFFITATKLYLNLSAITNTSLTIIQFLDSEKKRNSSFTVISLNFYQMVKDRNPNDGNILRGVTTMIVLTILAVNFPMNLKKKI